MLRRASSGGGHVSAATSRAFSPVALRWIVAVASGSFLLTVVLTLFAENLGEPISAGADSYSYGALGHRAFAELLTRSGVKVSRRRSERGLALDPSTALVVAEPPESFADSGPSQSRLLRMVGPALMAGAPAVFVLPKWKGTPHPARPGWVRDRRPLGIAAVQKIAGVLPLFGRAKIRAAGGDGPPRWTCATSWGENRRVEVEAMQLIEPAEGVDPVVSCGDGLLVGRLRGAGRSGDLILVSDPDLLNNRGLGEAQNAAVAGGLFLDELGVSRVVFDETIHGHVRTTGFFGELVRYPLVLALVHGLLLSLLVVWAGMGRFRKLEPPPRALGSGKEVLVQNAAQLMSVSGVTWRLLPSYLDGSIRAVAAHYFLPHDATRAELAKRLSEIARSRGMPADLATMRREADRLARAPRVQDARALELAREIHRWRKEMTDVH